MIITINQHDAEHYACYETCTKMTRAEVDEVERVAIRVIWSTADFGKGNGFQQRQYEVKRDSTG